MIDDTTILPFRQSESVADPLTELAREGARRMLAEALKAEADAFVASFADEQLEDGRQRIVRHGFGPERKIQTGIGALDVQRPNVRDRMNALDPSKKIRFTSSILPKWARRSVSLDALLPVLYLKGISTGDFQEALSAVMGPDAPNLSPSVILRLTAGWQVQYDAWARRDLSARHYVYIWADGVYLQARMEENAKCMLVIIGATPEGKKELIGFQVGLRESAQSWHELLADIKGRGLSVPLEIAVGDGAMGFWNALDKAFPSTKHQRCWVHKVKNVQNCFAKQMAPAIKSDLNDIQHAGTRARADAALALFCEKYGVKYSKAVTCLTKDKGALLAFFDFPAEHWGHLRTSNPIESVFATVRHRTVRTKGALSQKTAKLMVFTLIQAASKKWLRLKGRNQLPKVIEGLKFNDAVEVTKDTENRAAS
ncbi:putative transposase [Roseovarius sp. MBR-78]